jgi:hypothetical protein
MAEGRDLPARRRALRDDVGRLAGEVGRAVGEARLLGLPVEPGVGEARRRPHPLGCPPRPAPHAALRARRARVRACGAACRRP